MKRTQLWMLLISVLVLVAVLFGLLFLNGKNSPASPEETTETSTALETSSTETTGGGLIPDIAETTVPTQESSQPFTETEADQTRPTLPEYTVPEEDLSTAPVTQIDPTEPEELPQTTRPWQDGIVLPDMNVEDLQ